MRVLTTVASIMVRLTFMAGIDGMNFESMPELRHPRACPALLVSVFCIAAGMVL
jgi:magnesium transporter